MSFSSDVKDELARLKTEKNCCRLAELSAIIRVGGNLKLLGSSKLGIEISTASPATTRLIFSTLKNDMNIRAILQSKENKIMRKGKLHIINADDAMVPLLRLGIVTLREGMINIEPGIPKHILDAECCKRAYIRGAFLGGGSISDPEKGYHLEIVTHSDVFAVELCSLLEEYDIMAKIVERKGCFVVYVKEGDQIVDVMNVMGAHKSIFEYENVRIIKSMRNSVNRIVNCETANMSKTIEAALKQVSDIELIAEKTGLDSLDENVRELAELRLENQHATLSELGRMLSKPLGKSGVNHRMKKIQALAEELRRTDFNEPTGK